MKILQVISHYVPAYRFGGPLQVAHALGKALVQRGHAVTVCCTSMSDHQTDLEVPLDEPVDVDGVTVFYEPVTRLRKWGYSPSMNRRLKELVPDADFVMIHNHFQYAGCVGATHARVLNKPYMIFPHASLKRQSIRASGAIIKRLYLKWFDRKNYEQADYVAFNAKEELADSLFSSNGIVVPNGIHPQDFELLPVRGGFRSDNPNLGDSLVFLFLGRIDIRQKALDVMLEAFAKRVRGGSSAVLVLAGPSEGSDLGTLKRLVSELCLDGQVYFTGLVSGVGKKNLLRDADVFLMPSRYEGLSISLLEAMASGLPVIISDRCGLHQEIKRLNCGLVVEPDADAVAGAMATMEELGIRSLCGKNSREAALAEYTWPRIAESVEKLMLSRINDDR